MGTKQVLKVRSLGAVRSGVIPKGVAWVGQDPFHQVKVREGEQVTEGERFTVE